MPHNGPTVAHCDNLRVIDCYTCGYAHLYPVPDPVQIARFYSDVDGEYGTIKGEQWLAKEEREHKWGLWDTYYGWQADKMVHGLEGPTTLLDVGAGAGWFVRWWRDEFSPVLSVGVEPSRTARDWGAVELYESLQMLNSSPVVDVQFGLIHFGLVLEHAPDPVGLIESYLPKLHDRGRVAVVVPNEFNPLQRRLGSDYFVDYRHINYFTPATLRDLLESLGLTVIYEGATHPTELWRLAGFKGLAQCHQLRLWAEKILGQSMFRLYQYLYRSRGWGREIFMVAER